MKACRYCGYDITHEKILCFVGKGSPDGYCWPLTYYHGFRFTEPAGDEQHRFAMALRAAHIHTVELDDCVLADDDDIVKIEEVRRKHFGDFVSKVRMLPRRVTEQELERMERRYAESRGRNNHAAGQAGESDGAFSRSVPRDGDTT